MSQTLFSHLPCTFADGGFGAVETFHASRHGLALSQFARKVPSTPAVALLFVTVSSAGFHVGFVQGRLEFDSASSRLRGGHMCLFCATDPFLEPCNDTA